MRKQIVTTIVLSALVFCAVSGGCDSEPTVDATNEETLRKSVEAMSKNMDAAKKAKFEKAVGTLMFAKVLFAGGTSGGAPGLPPDEETAKKRVKEALHGKTADQIIAEADKVSAETKKQMETLMK